MDRQIQHRPQLINQLLATYLTVELVRGLQPVVKGLSSIVIRQVLSDLVLGELISNTMVCLW
jgi:hypothetical protein